MKEVNEQNTTRPQNEQIGWTKPQPEVLPQPTYWPAAMALGIIFVLWGAASSFIVSIVGLILLVVSLVGWIGEIRHEN
jgi:hypothetical protein